MFMDSLSASGEDRYVVKSVSLQMLFREIDLKIFISRFRRYLPRRSDAVPVLRVRLLCAFFSQRVGFIGS